MLLPVSKKLINYMNVHVYLKVQRAWGKGKLIYNVHTVASDLKKPLSLHHLNFPGVHILYKTYTSKG